MSSATAYAWNTRRRTLAARYANGLRDHADLSLPFVPEGFEAAKFVCSPPLRWRSEGHQAALWAGVGSGRMDAVATDHCPFTWEQKEAGRGDFRKIPNGAPGIENRLSLMFHGGVAEGRMSLNRWVELVQVACRARPGAFFRPWTNCNS